MKRFLRRTLLTVLALLLVLLAALAWLAGTESGLRLTWQHLVRPAVPELAAGEIGGRLIDGITLKDLRYENEQLLFAARSLELRWRPSRLFDRVVKIEALAGEGLRYEQRAPGSDEPAAFPATIQLPLAIELDALSIRDIALVIAPGADPLTADALELAGTWRDAQLDVSRLLLRRADLGLEGTAGLQTRDDYPLTGRLQWQAQLPDHAPLVAETRLSGSLRELHIEQTASAPYALQASAQLHEPVTGLQLDARVELQDTHLSAINTTWPDMRLAGAITVSGPPDALQLEGGVDMRDATDAILQLAFAGLLQPIALQLDRLQLSSPGRAARLDAQGSIGIGAEPAFDFQADWQALAWPLEGVADFESKQGHFTLTGTLDDYRLDASGDLKFRDLLDAVLAVRARSDDEPGSWRIETASLSRGKARLSASGLAGSVNDLAWQVDAPRLADLSPQATGRLQGRGRLSGRLPELSTTVQAQGAEIGFMQHRIGSLSIEGDVDLAGKRASRLQVSLSDALLAGTGVSRAAINGRGRPEEHTLEVELASDRGTADLALGGRWDGASWHFALNRAQVSYPELDSWQLAQPLTGTLSRERLALTEHCWVSGAARACGKFNGSPEAYAGTFTLSELPLTYFATLYPPGLALEGQVGAQGEFGKEARKPVSLNVRLDSTPVMLDYPHQEDDKAMQVSFAPGTVAVSLVGDRAELTLDLPFASGEGGVNAGMLMSLPADGDWLQGRLDGEMTLLWPDIGIVARWLPEVDALGGRIDGRMQITGTPAAPQLLGRLALTGATASLVTPGLELRDLNMELAGQPNGEVQLSASVRSGDGTLTGEGVLNPLERAARLTLRGERFQVMNTPEAQVLATPDLQLAIDPARASIKGQIEIPQARLRPRQLPPSAVKVSPDEVLVSDSGADEGQARYAVDARIRLILGEEVDIEGFGLSGKLKGNVLLIDQPAQPASATGEVSISDGRYQAYGQNLTIRTGRLLFAGGAVTKPGLDIEAVRTPDPNVLVGVRVRGDLRQPTFKLFSEPGMSQSAQLSWLVLGRPLEGGATDSERSTMQAAALMLGLSGGESIGKKVGEELGLDEVSIGAEEGSGETQASLLVGKYLTPELFVSYGIGLFEPLTTLRLRYTLSSRWKLVGEATAVGSSADLMYEIKKH